MSKNRTKSLRRLPRRSYILLFSCCFAEVSPAGNRAAPAGETHFPDLSSCGARTELTDILVLRAFNPPKENSGTSPMLDFPRSGGICSACRSAVAARRDGPPKEDFKIDPCETAAAGGELAYFCKRYMGSISTERRSRNISPPLPLLMYRVSTNRWCESPLF